MNNKNKADANTYVEIVGDGRVHVVASALLMVESVPALPPEKISMGISHNRPHGIEFPSFGGGMQGKHQKVMEKQCRERIETMAFGRSSKNTNKLYSKKITYAEKEAATRTLALPIPESGILAFARALGTKLQAEITAKDKEGFPNGKKKNNNRG